MDTTLEVCLVNGRSVTFEGAQDGPFMFGVINDELAIHKRTSDGDQPIAVFKPGTWLNVMKFNFEGKPKTIASGQSVTVTMTTPENPPKNGRCGTTA